MQDGRHFVPPQRLSYGRHISDLAFDEVPVANRGAMARNQVVENDDPVAGPMERLGGMAADVAGASGDEDGPPSTVQWRNT